MYFDGGCGSRFLLYFERPLQGLLRALDEYATACHQGVMKISTKNIKASFQKPKPVRAASKRQYAAAGGEVQVP